MRIKTLQIFIGITFGFLSLALFYFQIIHGNQYRQLSYSNCIRIIPQEGSRGRILDRNDNIIADNQLSYNVLFFPQRIDEAGRVLARLSAILGVSYQDLWARFKKSNISYSTPVILAQAIDKRNAIIIEEEKSELPGIMIQATPLRHYPHGSSSAHILGYLGEIDHWRLAKLKNYGYKSRDIVGYGGVEERYDYYLRPEEGGLQVEVNNRGRTTRVIGFRPPKNGKDIRLTIDLKVQKIIEEALADRTGTIIVLDPYSCEVLGMASFPNFAPAMFLQKSNSIAATLRDADAPMINRAISGLFPPASVFKLVVAAAGLETKKIDTYQTFFCPGVIKIGKQDYACWNTHGSQNLVNAITHSCDVFFYRLGLLLGPQEIYEYALRFGLGKTTQIDLPSESSGFVPSPLWSRLTKLRAWYPGDTANFTIGQGYLLVTPLQIARLMSSFANGGYLPQPYIIKAIDNRQVRAHKKMNTAVPLSRNVFRSIKKGLENTVMASDGTASVLVIPGLSISGKTGTAQVSRGQPHAWFAGFFPTEKPKYVICVFLEHSGPSYNACVLTKTIIEQMKAEGLL